jgi:hypothetical protein
MKKIKTFKTSINHNTKLCINYIDNTEGNLNLQHQIAVLEEDGIRLGSHFFYWKEFTELVSLIKSSKNKVALINAEQENIKQAFEKLIKVIS